MRKLLALLVLSGGLLLAAGCGSDDDDGEAAPQAGRPPQQAASCDKDSLELVNAGQLTIGTDNPAFPPWFEGTAEFDPWDPTTEPTKKGYEQEIAYGIAKQLGFTDDEVKWTVVPFNQSFKPGPKSFDFDINQISYKTERAEAVDFSESYYDVEQAIVTVEGSKIADAKSIADLKDAKLGAQIGTTSLEAINDTIQPRASLRLRHEQRRDRGDQGEADRRHRRRLPDRALHGVRAARGSGRLGHRAASGPGRRRVLRRRPRRRTAR